MNADKDTQSHHWPEEERSQRVAPKLSAYQRAVRWLQGAFAIGGVGVGRGRGRGQDAMRNVIGIGLSTDISDEANSDHEWGD